MQFHPFFSSSPRTQTAMTSLSSLTRPHETRASASSRRVASHPVELGETASEPPPPSGPALALCAHVEMAPAPNWFIVAGAPRAPCPPSSDPARCSTAPARSRGCPSGGSFQRCRRRPTSRPTPVRTNIGKGVYPPATPP